MTPLRILLADDDPDIRSFLASILRRRDFVVDSACDGIEALELLKVPGYAADLLITDVKMPRMDGVGLARAAAALYPDMPVLFISGWSEVDGPEWQKPGYAFLRKPFLPKALLNSIEDLLAPKTDVARA
jgi:DNA-binding NtrC family response regulator